MRSRGFGALWVLVLSVTPSTSWAGGERPENYMGRSPAQVAPGAKVIAVGKGSEESRCVRTDTSVLGFAAARAEYTFHSDRLCDVTFVVNDADFDALLTVLLQTYGEPWKLETQGKEKNVAWRVGKATVWLSQSDLGTRLRFWDDSQKELRWSDLLTGTWLSVLLALVGLFVAYFLVVGRITAWCPSCRSFGMRVAGRTSTQKDFGALPLQQDWRESVTYTYRCVKCGHGKVDRYSGRWSGKRT